MPDEVTRTGILGLAGDRGERIHTGLTFREYRYFGVIVAQWQRQNPGTVVRSRGNFSRSAGYGTITVTWWPAGEAERQ